MATEVITLSERRGAGRHLTEPAWVRRTLIAAVLGFRGLFLIVPLTAVFVEAFAQGREAYVAAISEPDAVAALRLTLLTAVIAVPCNLVFGICAAWAIARFEFRGKNFLTTMIDLPFAVSPVISGMVFVLRFGRRGYLGAWLAGHG